MALAQDYEPRRVWRFFLRLAVALPAFGYTPEDFLKAMNSNQKESAQNALEASPIYGPLTELLKRKLQFAKSYVTTATELLEALNSQLKGRTVPG